MYKKCENCYKDGKVPNEESCKKCEDDLKRKEQSLEKIKLMLQTIIETNKIYPLQNNLLKLLDIIEGKENE